MGYQKRQLSEGDVYHITNRGVGRQMLFEDEKDYRVFMRLLFGETREAGAELYAWCLMDNHVHLLFHGELDLLSNLMQKIEGEYAIYFNQRHDHVGHVFQGRFHSVPVTSDAQLLSTVIYIHRNPLEAGLANGLNWRWSSYSDYLTGRGTTSTAFVLEVFGGIKYFEELHHLKDAERDLNPSSRRPYRYKVDEASEIYATVLSRLGLSVVPVEPREERDKVLHELKAAGVSVRQLERFTGLGRGIISRA